jgi:uncharacterized protein (TIGR02145 family)
MNGKQVARIQSYLQNYLQEFSLSGINSGLYLVSVKGNTYQYSGKLLCNGKSNGTISIEKVSNNTQVADKKVSNAGTKSAPAPVEMSYTTGDWLKFTGISGIYSTIVTDVPTATETITFNFIACTDGDGNNYPVVEIGTQVWMAENLKTTTYNDGTTSIPNVTDNDAWGALTTPGYCWYNNDAATHEATYGALYNWYIIAAPSKGGENVCPTGWHVPTDDEWTTLTTYLGGESVAGGELKETGTTHWTTPNTAATDETGFTALPGGYRYFDGTYGGIGGDGNWWSSTESAPTYAFVRSMYYVNSVVDRYGNSKPYGFSVRCLQDL